MANASQSFASNSRIERNLVNSVVAVQQETLVFSLPFKRVLFLGLLVLLSAIGFVYVQEHNRFLFVEYQNLQKQYQTLHTERSKMTLERNFIASRPQVQEIAEQKFQMHMPMADEVVMVES